MLQLGVSVAAGIPWLGMPVLRTGSVLVVSAEDDREEVWRRLHAIKRQYSADGEWTEATDELVTERLYIVDRVGDDNRLTTAISGELVRTAMADRIAATAAELPGPVLIVLDPLARFDGGDPNANDDGTRLIECAEHIRKETSATVLLPHHVNKASQRDRDSAQHAARGASGLVDGCRWMGLLHPMTADEAPKYGIDEADAGFYVRYTIPKANGLPPWGGMWLRRLPGGVLAPVELQDQKADRQERKKAEKYAEIVEGAKRIIRQNGPMSNRQLRLDYGGTSGPMQAGEKAIRGALNTAVDTGDLLTRTANDGRTELLEVPKGDE